MIEYDSIISKRVKRRAVQRKAMHKRNRQRKYTSFKLEREWIDYDIAFQETSNTTPKEGYHEIN